MSEPVDLTIEQAKVIIDHWASKTIVTAGGIYTLVRASWIVLEELRRLERHV